MASVNQQSLREEFATLKAEFERLSAEGKMAAEMREAVLLAVFETSLGSQKHADSAPKQSTVSRGGRHYGRCSLGRPSWCLANQSLAD